MAHENRELSQTSEPPEGVSVIAVMTKGDFAYLEVIRRYWRQNSVGCDGPDRIDFIARKFSACTEFVQARFSETCHHDL